MKGYEPEVIKTLNDEELDLLIIDIKAEKEHRARLKREELINTFKKAWKAIEEAGYDVLFREEPLLFTDIEIY